MDVQFDHEKSFGDTYYIPVTLFTCMKEHFPILAWADMFQTSPQFAHLYGPPEILVAIEKCLRGDQNPWKDARRAIGDKPKILSLTHRPHQTKRSVKRPQPDTRSEIAIGSAPSTWQDWSSSRETWTGWRTSTSSWAESGWQVDPGTGASYRDAPLGASEDQFDYGFGIWEAEDHSQSRRYRAASHGGRPDVFPPWQRGKRT